MNGRDIVVVGASAGGIEALQRLLPLLPADLKAALFVVVHRSYPEKTPAGSMNYLRLVLARSAQLSVVDAQDGQVFEHGCVYLAPARARLLFEKERLRIDDTPETRPPLRSIDALFRSAASQHGSRVVAVLLSGMLDDGTGGLWDVRRQGGVTLVQDPAEARFPSMPQHGMSEVLVHSCLPLREIAPRLVQLSTEAPPQQPARRSRVLIVEDELVVATSLESRLVALGYDVVASVSSGEDALTIAPAASPDVVLMDIRLSGRMKGTEAARRLYDAFRLPIVYLTAYADEETLAEARPSRPSAFITKPYRVPEIHAAIELALDRREHDVLST
jgi:chemotaxis response regulator CheB